MSNEIQVQQRIVSANKLESLHVLFEKTKKKKGEELTETHKYGRIRACVFHPKEKRCIGFLIKRPDLLLMFHRPDSFVPLDGIELVEDGVQLLDDAACSGEAACRKLGINWDDCVMWLGMPVCYANGEQLGYASDVAFDLYSGKVASIRVDEGATAAALLGRKEIPAKLILGFKRGLGTALLQYYQSEEGGEEGEPPTGALLVSDEVKTLSSQEGLAAKAGRLTGEVQVKAKEKVEAVKPAAQKAAKATGEAVNKGAYATGKQVARAKGMFGAFIDEYKKASK